MSIGGIGTLGCSCAEGCGGAIDAFRALFLPFFFFFFCDWTGPVSRKNASQP